MDCLIPIHLLNSTSYARLVYKNTLAVLCEPADGDQVDEELWLRQTETDERLARESQPKEYGHQDQQRPLPLELEEWALCSWGHVTTIFLKIFYIYGL